MQSDHFEQARAELPAYLEETPRIINTQLEGTEWSELGELAVEPVDGGSPGHIIAGPMALGGSRHRALVPFDHPSPGCAAKKCGSPEIWPTRSPEIHRKDDVNQSSSRSETSRCTRS